MIEVNPTRIEARFKLLEDFELKAGSNGIIITVTCS